MCLAVTFIFVVEKMLTPSIRPVKFFLMNKLKISLLTLKSAVDPHHWLISGGFELVRRSI